ncbi:MAG: prepilin-type N-terminal cleavage/methylation domain-containing protein [bacterium]|nr:prepilin-type N-terminal cleavage/methylation domain-containing protein [bacterium]
MAKGFTLVEVLAAMFIMLMGVLGVFGLITRTVAFNSSVNSQLVASYLAQEGLEIVRNIRDANFLQVHKGVILPDQWNYGLTSCDAGCEADYNYNDDVVALGSFQNTPLKLNGDGFYTYDAGTDTIFKRKIIITCFSIDALGMALGVSCISPPTPVDLLKIAVDVSWQDKGSTRTVKGATELYNWLTPTPAP